MAEFFSFLDDGSTIRCDKRQSKKIYKIRIVILGIKSSDVKL